tara:strand:+ start:9822 stop:9989 length:168 start_codon:yes stop_codon:yes gene_type:complete
MNTVRIITGLTVEEQMKKAKFILEHVIIPRNDAFAKRQKMGLLSTDTKVSVKQNA